MASTEIYAQQGALTPSRAIHHAPPRVTVTYIALLRGINVGGRNTLPMRRLVTVFENLEARNVKTYIQSGNVVFQHEVANVGHLSKRIEADIRESFGIEPRVFVMTLADLESAMRNNPFPGAELSPKSLHLGFLSFTPKAPDLEKMQALKKDSEQFHLIGRVFYLYAPDGIGKSKLAASSEKLLGVPMTDRNWNTVCRLMELANQAL